MTERVKRLSPCPNPDCRAARPEQRSLTHGERDEIPTDELHADASADRCGYCGCVYTREASGYVNILGWLGGMPPGWVPRRDR